MPNPLWFPSDSNGQPGSPLEGTLVPSKASNVPVSVKCGTHSCSQQHTNKPLTKKPGLTEDCAEFLEMTLCQRLRRHNLPKIVLLSLTQSTFDRHCGRSWASCSGQRPCRHERGWRFRPPTCHHIDRDGCKNYPQQDSLITTAIALLLL